MKETLKSKKGITLITLVITIIILIILAGISISLLMGEDGLITKAKQGTLNYQNAALEEQERLNALYGEMDSGLVTGSTSDGGTQINPGTTGGGLTAQEHAWLEQLATGGGSGSGSLTSQEHEWLRRIGEFDTPLYDINPTQNTTYSSGYYIQFVTDYNYSKNIPCAGYSKMSVRVSHSNSVKTKYCFQLADGTYTEKVNIPNQSWIDYVDIPENAICINIGDGPNGTYTVFYSLLVN